MTAIVIEGNKKSDFDIFIALAKKLGLKVHSIKEDILETPNIETIKAMIAAENGEVKKYKNSSEMLSELNKKAKSA
jgi:hypothetical protein